MTLYLVNPRIYGLMCFWKCCVMFHIRQYKCIISGNHKNNLTPNRATLFYLFSSAEKILHSYRPDEIFMSLHFANLVHLCNVLQATSEQRTCHSFMGVGLAQWDVMTRRVNCSSEIKCQLIVEPLIDPPGYTADCSDHWATKYTPCWNECRKKVDIGGFMFEEICSFCCEDELCNVPSAFGYPVPETGAACAHNSEFSLWFMVTVIILCFL